MKKIIILGAGMVGAGAMAIDLAKKHNVSSVDFSSRNLDLLPRQHPQSGGRFKQSGKNSGGDFGR